MKGTVKGRRVFEVPKLRLDVKSLGLGDDRLNEVATIIARETEAQREIHRAKYPDTHPEGESPNKLMSVLGGYYSYANSLRWDLLLTFGDCANRCAKRAGMDRVALVDFAREQCEPTEPWLLFWFGSALRAYRESVHAEIDAQKAQRELAEVQAKHQKIRAGARAGGQKSAQRRRQIQRTPASDVLLQERRNLIEGGMEERNVASFQANKYKVSPAAIRAAYKRN